MAPGLIDPVEQPTVTSLPSKKLPVKHTSVTSYEPGRTITEDHTGYEHEDLKPVFPDITWPALEEVPYEDKGLKGDPQFRNLLSLATDVWDYSPRIGTELEGVRLKDLLDNDAAKNDLARLIATRGVVFFRNQDDFDIDDQRRLGEYYGVLHKHATTSTPARLGLEDVHVVYAKENSQDMRAMLSPEFLWHSDVTYERQPPSYTSLKLLTGPPRGGGGDTLWSSQYAAYDALSAPMQKYLEGLTALHSAKMQADGSRELGRTVRREAVVTEHPLIRTHPVTGWKFIFYNPGFVTSIVGVPKMESDLIKSYLDKLVSDYEEAHVRFLWGKNDVAFWDNRVTNHRASYGFSPHRRHAVRVCSQAERPFFDPAGKSQEEEYIAKGIWGKLPVNKDGAGVVNYND